MIKVYDHNTSPIWSKLYRETFIKTKRTNGVYTYSKEIVKYHIPVIKKVLGEDADAIIMTAGYTYDLKPKDLEGYKLIVEYLHERPERDLERVIKNTAYDIKHIYITGRYKLKQELDNRHIPCIWLPMSVDGGSLKPFIKYNRLDDKRIVFFGNAYFGKRDTFAPLKKYFNSIGWKLDSICHNYYMPDEGRKLKVDRKQIFDILSRYKYGIGNGRCALEMWALGLKVLLSAAEVGGIITNDAEYDLQSKINFASVNGYTFSRDYKKCFENIDKSIIRYTDVTEVLSKLETELTNIINKMEI